MVNRLLALLLILPLSPLFPLIALLIKMTSKGPVFYLQERTGKDGKVFTLYKFRTMRQDAEMNGPVLAKDDDPRITSIGKILRETYLDEIPQLFNIIKGEMNFVGPRPERPFFNEKFSKEFFDWPKRLLVKPGITGWAQIHNFSSHQPREKLQYDLDYIKNKNWLLDLKIVARTFLLIFGIKPQPSLIQKAEQHLQRIQQELTNLTKNENQSDFAPSEEEEEE